MAMIALNMRNMLWTQIGFVITGVLGLGCSAWRSTNSRACWGRTQGRTMARSSAFFALVGCHGLHVTIGLLWLGTMMAQVFTKGFRQIVRRTLCFALFWHALDIIWVGIFTNVYLLGTTTCRRARDGSGPARRRRRQP